MGINNYRDLIAWQKSMNLVDEVYALTNDFPKREVYSLTSQIRRCAISVPSNIAEGYGRGSTKSYINFLRIARGSLLELETQIIICQELEFISGEQTSTILNLILEENKMLNALIRSIDK